MRRFVAAVAIMLAVVVLAPVSAASPSTSDRSVTAVADPFPVIVTLDGSLRAPARDRRDLRAIRQQVRAEARRLGVTPTDIYPSIGHVFRANVTPAQRAALEREPRVVSVRPTIRCWTRRPRTRCPTTRMPRWSSPRRSTSPTTSRSTANARRSAAARSART